MLIKEDNFNLKLVLILAAFLVYANSLASAFIWDDYPLILKNYLIQDWRYLPRLFNSDLYQATWGKTNYYRPMVSLSFMWDHFLWDRISFGYHLTNVFIHLINAILVFSLFKKMTNQITISFWSSLLFLIHPFNPPVVAYISGRSDSLAMLFILLSFLYYLNYSKQNKLLYYLLSIISFIFALLSREITVIFPFLILLHIVYFQDKTKDKFKFFLPYLLISFVYIVLRFTALNFAYQPAFFSKLTLFERLINIPKLILTYLQILLFPFNLHMEKIISISRSLIEIQSILFFSLLILVIYLTILLHKKNKLISFGLLWFIIALFPVIGLLPLNILIADHWVYLASLGFFLSLTTAFNLLIKNRQNLILAFVCLIFSFITIYRNTDWQDEMRFYNRILKYSPNSALVHNNLGVIYESHRNYELAKKEYLRAIEIDPKYADSASNLASIYKREEKFNEASKYFEKSLSIEPDRFVAHNSLGIVYGLTKQEEKAEKEFKKAIELNTYFAEGYYNLGVLYFQQKKYNQAVDVWQQMLKIEPQNSFIKMWIKTAQEAMNAKPN